MQRRQNIIILFFFNPSAEVSVALAEEAVSAFQPSSYRPGVCWCLCSASCGLFDYDTRSGIPLILIAKLETNLHWMGASGKQQFRSRHVSQSAGFTSRRKLGSAVSQKNKTNEAPKYLPIFHFQLENLQDWLAACGPHEILLEVFFLLRALLQ